MAEQESTDPTPPAPPDVVVGLGGSAGGVTALRDFFANVRADSGQAFVVVLHLSPDHESRLAEVLQSVAAIPVSQVTNTVRIERNHAYVVSPNQSLSITDGLLVPAAMVQTERRAPVDMFFRALADAHASRAVSVILSGTGSDGASGSKRIKEQGGLVVAQEPASAQFQDMPAAAIATGLVDLVLLPADMPSHLLDYARRHDRSVLQIQTGPGEPDFAAVREILTMVRARTGHDFTSYKPGTVLRRIARRMNVKQIPTLQDYARLARDDAAEAGALMKDLLISVTNFFRDPEAFAELERLVIPHLFAADRMHDQVRVWSAGCATGEEAYSLAMLLIEAAAAAPEPPAVQVFATDIDEAAIAVAREGFYPNADVADVSEARLQRFFHRAAGGYRIQRELREVVLFANHNLIRDPPFSHLDLIACRNVLIYLNRTVQERAFATFHFALRPGGFLFLGQSESPQGTDLFLPLDKSAHIFESRTVSSRRPLPVSEPTIVPPRGAPRLAEFGLSHRLIPADLHLRLLEQYAPPSAVVTDEHNVVHLTEGAARYLVVPPGEPSRDITRLARPELRSDLRAALHQAARERTSVDVRRVRVVIGDAEVSVRLRIRPALQEGHPPTGFFLILFEEEREPVAERPVELTSPIAVGTARLDEELARVKEQLRGTIEQYETQVEEAKASNEELQALNEELRSSAEELETSKEELQSVNEELTTVNEELKIKVEELAHTNNDFVNFMNSTDIASIFLDRQMRVKLSTPRAADIFNLLPADRGRPLSDITSRLVHDRLQDDVRSVLEHLQMVERELSTPDGLWYLMRVTPYRTVDDRIEGVILTFVDITSRRQAEERVRAGEERLRLLIDSTVDYAIFTMSDDGVIDSWNSGAQRMFGFEAPEILGQPVEILFTPEDRAADVPADERARAAALGRADDERWRLRKDGSRLYCSGITMRLGDGHRYGFAKIARDLTAKRQADDALRRAHADLEARVRDRTRELQARVADHVAAEEHVTSLLHKVVTSQEDERARIARDLHDQLGQQLTALRLALERHRDRCTTDESQNGDLPKAIALASQIGRDADFLAWELRPAVLDDLGLAAALPRFVDEWSKHYGISAECHTARFAQDDLPREAEVTFYRVAQEALNNVVKHAHASRVDILLESRDRIVALVVEDDGIGFDVSNAAVAGVGIGLLGMRERAALIGATLDIESSPGRGTTVYLRKERP